MTRDFSRMDNSLSSSFLFNELIMMIPNSHIKNHWSCKWQKSWSQIGIPSVSVSSTDWWLEECREQECSRL